MTNFSLRARQQQQQPTDGIGIRNGEFPTTDHCVLTLSCLCLDVAHSNARTSFYDAASYDLLSWLRPAASQESHRKTPLHKHIILPEDPHEDQAALDLESLASLQDERPFTRTDRSLLPEYRNLCETATRKVELSNDPNYEYQPPHYFEVFCKSYSLAEAESRKTETSEKQKCAHPSFHCIQRSRTLFMLRRRWDAECWEPTTKVVASGCDCMWPTSNLGDVTIHY